MFPFHVHQGNVRKWARKSGQLQAYTLQTGNSLVTDSW